MYKMEGTALQTAETGTKQMKSHEKLCRLMMLRISEWRMNLWPQGGTNIESEAMTVVMVRDETTGAHIEEKTGSMDIAEMIDLHSMGMDWACGDTVVATITAECTAII